MASAILSYTEIKEVQNFIKTRRFAKYTLSFSNIPEKVIIANSMLYNEFGSECLNIIFNNEPYDDENIKQSFTDDIAEEIIEYLRMKPKTVEEIREQISQCHVKENETLCQLLVLKDNYRKEQFELTNIDDEIVRLQRLRESTLVKMDMIQKDITQSNIALSNINHEKSDLVHQINDRILFKSIMAVHSHSTPCIEIAYGPNGNHVWLERVPHSSDDEIKSLIRKNYTSDDTHKLLNVLVNSLDGSRLRKLVYDISCYTKFKYQDVKRFSMADSKLRFMVNILNHCI